MKKKLTVVFLCVIAAVAAAFAFGGCKGTETPPAGKREYVVFEDGCGKKYNMHGGEQITVYYDFDAEKVLEFNRIYYNEATGEERSRSEASVKLPCYKPTVYTYSAYPLNAEGNEEECALTIIISAQEICDNLVENSYRPVRNRIFEKAGAVYTFVPEWNGKYTISCVCEEEGEVADLTVADNTGKTVEEDGIFHKGWTYYVHIKVKSEEYDKSVIVSTTVTFTPPVVKEGENEITFIGNGFGSTSEFTPEESGIYTAVSDADGRFRFMDGETYESVCINTNGEAAVLEAGKRYIIASTVGYQTERQATLTVKRVDRAFAADSENNMNWNEAYVFTAEKCGNYNFKVSEDYGDVATVFNVYRENGWLKYSKPFIDSGEFDLVLEAGKYVLSVSHSGKATASYAPNKIKLNTNFYVQNGEILSFIAPFCCKYNFSFYSYDNNGYELSVTDKDGKDVKQDKLSAGEEYFVVLTWSNDDWNYRRQIKVEVLPEGELAHNRETEIAGGNSLYTFTPAIYGRYKFTGASTLSIYDSSFEKIETDGDTARLTLNKYYVVVTGEKFTVKFYPQQLPTDGVTHVSSHYTMWYTYFELPFDDEVTIILKHWFSTEYSILDGDLNEITAGELTESYADNQFTVQLKAGCYYLYVSLPAEVSFAEQPLGCGGVCTVEKNDRLLSSPEAEYRYDCELGTKEISVRIFDLEIEYYDSKLETWVSKDIWDFNLKNVVHLYYMDGGIKKPLTIKSIIHDPTSLDMGGGVVKITFYAKPEVGEYFIEFDDGFSFNFSVA